MRRSALVSVAALALVPALYLGGHIAQRTRDRERFFQARRAEFALLDLARALDCYRAQHSSHPQSIKDLYTSGCMFASTGYDVHAPARPIESPLAQNDEWTPLEAMFIRRGLFEGEPMNESTVIAVVLPFRSDPDVAFVLLASGEVRRVGRTGDAPDDVSWRESMGNTSIWPDG